MKPKFLDFLPSIVRNRRVLTYFSVAQLTVGIVAANLGHPHVVLNGVTLAVTFVVAIFSRGEV